MGSSDVYKNDQPPTASTTGGNFGQGSFRPRRATVKELHDEIPSILALQKWASQHAMAPSLEAFVNYGAEDNESLQANRKGFDRYALRPRILKDVATNFDTSVTILQGRVKLSLPLCVAPFAGCRALHPDGELAIAKAAAAAGIAYTIPNWASIPIEDIVRVHQDASSSSSSSSFLAPLFVQLYPQKPVAPSGEGIHRTHMEAVLRYLSSFSKSIVAVIVTCDTVNNGNREVTYKNKQWVPALNEQVGGFPEPCALPHDELPSIGEPGHSAQMTWDDIRWMKVQCKKHNLALCLKGIMTKEDTQLAVKAGVDAVIVSNHGGRQLDGTLGTVEVIAECVDAARGSPLEIFVDGGCRRGKDMVKCLALGAKCIMVGRPVLWGLAAAGEEGVAPAPSLYRGGI
mmetsp:Transcript_11888/g.21997  ORF Transcript_11888/g.21997 Transcript_11888/m.21997 type:complete len:400 (-) Transcript_11888:12-1211(-)